LFFSIQEINGTEKIDLETFELKLAEKLASEHPDYKKKVQI